MTERQLRDEMVQIGASLFNRGYATGSAGNLSLLLPDGNLLATPTGAGRSLAGGSPGPCPWPLRKDCEPNHAW